MHSQWCKGVSRYRWLKSKIRFLDLDIWKSLLSVSIRLWMVISERHLLVLVPDKHMDIQNIKDKIVNFSVGVGCRSVIWCGEN